MSNGRRQLDASQLRRWACAFALTGLTLAPHLAYAEASAAVGWVDPAISLAEVIFPDLRVEVDDRHRWGATLAWPMYMTLLDRDDGLAAVDLMAEPQLRVDHIDARLAGGLRGNWNVFDLYGVRDDAGLFAEAGALYDDFPAAFAGGGIGASPREGLGLALMYRRVWTIDEAAADRHEMTVDLFWNFER